MGGLVAIVASALLMDEATPFPARLRSFRCSAPPMLVAAGARLPDEGISRALSNPVARYIGRVSYAWYLWHWPVLVIANSRFGEASTGVSADGETAAGHAGWPVVLAAVALSFALAVASHYLVEQPMRQARLPPGVAAAVAAVRGCPRRSLAHRRGRALSGRGRGAGRRRPRASGHPADPREVQQQPADGERAARRGVPPRAREGQADHRLIGDSHSQHWQPAMQRLAEERGWTGTSS